MNTKLSRIFIPYFHSGWTFLVPYLAVYLLYAWLKWPVNPAGDASGVVKGINESVTPFPHSLIPSLLHVYWFLHAVHVILAAVALITWWRDKRSLQNRYQGGEEAGTSLRRDSTRFAEPSTTRYPLLDTLPKAAPWVFLALIFYIPGIYLEWPADPWEHLRRINEWHAHSLVTEHTSWRKSSYFLPYSLTQHVVGLTQLSWLNLYYTAMCLILSWQYYRLARAVGLGERAAMIFVILQALLMGNNIFSFYRYYGLSSTILAQIGAIAFTRLALEAANNPQFSFRGFFFLSRHRSERKSNGNFPAPSLPHSLSTSRTTSFLHSHTPSLLLLAPCSLLLLFTFFNHIQGIGIAGLGILAVIVWRLIEWKRAMIGWVAGAAVVLSIATVLWFPRHPALDEVYHPQGWLTEWYGFNFFSLSSPTFERSLHILGAFGVLNLVLGLWLIVRKNHVAGWLTLTPVIALAMPCFALPFAHVLATHPHPESIITFHRFLFTVPLGLAVVALASSQTRRQEIDATHVVARAPLPSFAPLGLTKGFVLPVAGLAGAVALSPGAPMFNRLWHSLHVTPNDLSLRHHIAAWTPENLYRAADESTLTIAHPLAANTLAAICGKLHEWTRAIHEPLALGEIERQLDTLALLKPSEWQLALTKGHDTWFRFARTDLPESSDLIALDLTGGDTRWLTLGGREPEYEHTDGRLIIRNAPAAPSDVFSPQLLPVDGSKRYQLTSAMRQTGNPEAVNYLAVAWYDRAGNLLHANVPPSDGAGLPTGWSNGTYSYYGLVARPASAGWTTYSISFGLGHAAIPANAAFFRLGARLNFNSVPDATVALSEVFLTEIPAYDTLLFAVPSLRQLYSTASTSAILSQHWRPQTVAVVSGGGKELRNAFPRATDPVSP